MINTLTDFSASQTVAGSHQRSSASRIRVSELRMQPLPFLIPHSPDTQQSLSALTTLSRAFQ